MQEQTEISTSELTKTKPKESNKKQQSPSKNYQETELESIPSTPPTSTSDI